MRQMSSVKIADVVQGSVLLPAEKLVRTYDKEKKWEEGTRGWGGEK